MGIFNSRSKVDRTARKWTHEGTFYCIPVLMNMDTNVVMGKNIVFDYLLLLATYFHINVIDRSKQFLAALFNYHYEPGFPFKLRKIDNGRKFRKN